MSLQVVFLVDRCLLSGAVDLVEESESTLSPDNKATEMATRSELEKVQSADIDELNTGQVAECLDDTVVLVVDNERTTALAVSAVPEFSFTSTELAGVGDLDDISVGVEVLEESDGLLCLGVRLGGVVDDERNFLDLLDAVTTSKDEGRKGRGSKGRNNGETALVLVDLDVPFAPGLGRRKHASTTAHVTEGSLEK